MPFLACVTLTCSPRVPQCAATDDDQSDVDMLLAVASQKPLLLTDPDSKDWYRSTAAAAIWADATTSTATSAVDRWCCAIVTHPPPCPKTGRRAQGQGRRL